MDDTKLWKVFSEFIRRRDANEDGFVKCFTCPRILHWKKADCGHGIPCQHKSTKFNEKNNHAQCKPCNGFEGGRREVYKEEMNKRYGEYTWDLMELASKKASHWTQFEVDALTEYYKKKVSEFPKTQLR